MELKYDDKNIKIYKGDNQEVLESLESGSIDLIYCDILYNSGKVFDDYNDNLGSAMEALEWYRPRIKEMHRVLATNGSIYIHCNWRIDSYMRILLDEIFGFYNFRNRIYRKHSEERGFYNNYDSEIDVIFYYTKDKNKFTFNPIKGDKLQIYPLFENGYTEERSYNFIWNGINFEPAKINKHWLISQDILKSLCDKDEVDFIDGLPYRKTYDIPIGNLWEDDDMLDEYSRTYTAEGYDTPKPDSVLERIINISSNPGDVVADFFLGGGTTAVQTVKLGRKGIFCDISEKACNVSVNKIKNI